MSQTEVGMDEAERERIERACERLVNEYVQALDLGPVERAAELFTDDGAFVEPHMEVRGREALNAHFAPGGPPDTVASRHIVTNLVIDVVDENRATGTSYLTYFATEAEVDRRLPAPLDPPSVLAVYRDTFVRTSAGWRFERKEVTATHVAARLIPLYEQVVLGDGQGRDDVDAPVEASDG